tara:strand:- start:241 stop:975 length:735 start_codon:yes stop_codon:yes gene_type:complete
MGKSNKTDVKKGSKTGKTSKSAKEKEIELEKEKIESDSEIESENEAEESDSDQENEDDQEEEEEQDLAEPDSVEKKVLTFESVYTELTKIRKDISELESDKAKLISDHDKAISKILADIKKERSKEKKEVEALGKVHQKEIKQAKKEKRKRNGENKGGFNKETEVPETLREFLELEEGTMLARPKVMSLLNAKFIQLGLKKGQEVELDKKTAKKFGLKAGHVIGFTEFQRFIADQYPKTKSVDV